MLCGSLLVLFANEAIGAPPLNKRLLKKLQLKAH